MFLLLNYQSSICVMDARLFSLSHLTLVSGEQCNGVLANVIYSMYSCLYRGGGKYHLLLPSLSRRVPSELALVCSRELRIGSPM